MKPGTVVLQPVRAAARSPLNPRQWLCELPCGHEQWVTSVRSPKRVQCSSCIAQLRERQRELAESRKP